MLKNFLTIAWRSLNRQKFFSFLNIFGLALGLTCTLLIFFWIDDERSMDGFHANGKYLFQVYQRQYYDGKIEASYPTPGLLAEELKKSIPEIAAATGIEYASAPGSQNTFRVGEKISKMGGAFAGSDFFSMFSFPLLAGSPKTALNSPVSIAISHRMALYFFGGADHAIGQSIRMDDNQNLLVTAVYEIPQTHSTIQFDFFRSWIAFIKENDWVNNWGNTDPSTIIQLRSSADPNRVEAKIRDFITRYKPNEKGYKTELGMQPFPEKYLHSVFKQGQLSGGRIEYVRLFTVVAIFILAIACINFMNLTTAQSARRAKEVGLRKVIGANRPLLILQFIGEACLLALISTIIALVATSMLMPAFNYLTGKSITLPFNSALFWIRLVALSLLTGFIAGSYPALFLSSLQPIRIFRGNTKLNWEGKFIRQGLVIFQFVLSIMLTIGMIVIYRQMSYIQSKDLGYERENLVYIPVEGELVKRYSLFKDGALKLPGIISVSKMRNTPTLIYHHNSSISWPGMDPNLVVSFADEVVGYDFVKTMKLKMNLGRDFSPEFATDSLAFIINQTAADRMSMNDPVGKFVTWGRHTGKIIGVLKDFHFNTMHSTIEPLILRLKEDFPWGTILVRIESGKTKEAITGLERISKSINPQFPFTFQFSDQEFARLYSTEQVISKLANCFAALAIFISLLGLFGLAAYTASQKNKEIGIRKVLGASIPVIAAMLSREFLRLVVIAILIAIPISWYVSNQWLQNFAYKINLDWWIFVLAAGFTIVIAMLTVSYQSLKAGMVNPVKTLRSE